MNISKWRSTDEAKWRQTKTKRGKSKAFTIWGKIKKKKGRKSKELPGHAVVDRECRQNINR